MSGKITAEMEELEKQKIFFQQQARYHELKIQRIKAIQNLENIEAELAKMESRLVKKQRQGGDET